jgi:phage FluMu protein Com
MLKTLVFLEITCANCKQKSLLNIFDVYDEASWTCANCQKLNQVVVKEEFKKQADKIKDFVIKVQMVADHALNSGISYKEDEVSAK